MDKKKRLGIQAIATLIQNCNFKGFFLGEIYKGQTKNVCVPGINCYSCPGAVASCPVGALQNELSAWKFRFPYYVVGLLILFGTIMGRLVCGFLCPFGFVQDLINRIPVPGKVKKLKGEFVLRKIRWLILIGFVIVLPIVVKLTPFFCKYICPSGTLAGLLLSIGNTELFGQYGSIFAIKLSILLGIIILGLFVSRPFCKYLCPLGLIYGWFNKISLVRMHVDTERCTHCGICEKVCDMCVNPSLDPNHTECIRCMHCIKECPAKALSFGIKNK